MCDPVTLGYVLTAVGTAGGAVNNYRALNKQDAEAARGIREQGRIQQDTNQRVAQQVKDIAGSDSSAERAQSLAGYQQALRAADARSTGGVNADLVGANPRYAAAVADAVSGIRSDAQARAGRASVIDAETLKRMNESDAMLRTRTDVAEKRREAQAADFINRLRISEHRPNSFVGALTQIMQGVGSGLTLGGGLPKIGTPDLGKLYNAGTLIDAPAYTPDLFAKAAKGALA